MSAAAFLFYDAVGALIWAGVRAGVGTLFSSQLEQLAQLVDRAGGLLLAIVAIGFAGFIGYKFYHRQKFLRDLRMAKISVDELKQRMDAGHPITVVDVRHPLALALDPEAISGTLNVSMEDIEHRHHEIPRDREIILYCTCPNEVSSARTAMLLKKNGVVLTRPTLARRDVLFPGRPPARRRPRRLAREEVSHRAADEDRHRPCSINRLRQGVSVS